MLSIRIYARKRKLKAEGYVEVYEKIVHLKMTVPDNKNYMTEAADTTTLQRVVQSVTSPKAEPLKRWLAEVGTQRIEEIENPEVAMEVKNRSKLSEANKKRPRMKTVDEP